MRIAATRFWQRGLSTVLILVLVVVLLLITSGATVAALYLVGAIGNGSTVDEHAGEGKTESQKPAIYLPVEPALIANFDKRGQVGFLQVSVELMARDQTVLDAARKHMAVVRNNLLLLMSSKSYEELADRAGKEALRQQALEAVNNLLAERHVDGRVEAVYFTAFVMQ